MPGSEISNRDEKFSAWFGQNYLNIVMVFLFLFTLLPVLAPVLVKAGFELPACLIYWSFSNLCHQLPYRSWFLFGLQAYYPLETTDPHQMMDFATAFHYTGELELSRSIIGSEVLGYKIAVCQRDVAMYVGFFMVGLLFSLSGKKWSKIPLWVWLVFGVIPLGIDGLTQLAGSLEGIPIDFPWRESTPLLRTTTGALFGIFTGLIVFPAMESIMRKK